MIEGIFIEGLIYGIMVLGVFITFRILDFPDLTVDGSFPLGAAIMASMISAGHNLLLALIVSFVGGMIAGMITALIHNKLKIPSLLAGILTMTMLYSINLRIMGTPNMTLLGKETVFTELQGMFEGVLEPEITMLIFFIIVAIGIKFLLDIFFRTDLGMTMGAMGSNEQMVISQGVNPEHLKMIGVGLSNGLVALSGAFAAQYIGFADINLGLGTIVSGLSAVMIGEFVLRSNKITILTLRVIIGAIIFKGIMYGGRELGFYVGITANDFKLINGLMIIGLLALTMLRDKKSKGKEKVKGKEKAKNG